MDELLQLWEIGPQAFGVGHSSAQSFLVLGGLSFARLIAFVQMAPFCGGAAVPSRVKVSLAAALGIVLYPSLVAELGPLGTSLPFGPVGFIALLAKEVAVGFALGFAASLAFEAIHTAGRIIDMQRGATMGELYAPQINSQVSELGQFKLQVSLVIFLTIGAHHAFLKALLQSFRLIPIFDFPHIAGGWSPLAEFFAQASAQTVVISVQLAAPAVIALLLTDVFFGVINRVAPQINVFFLSMPFKMLIGVLVVALALFVFKERSINFFTQSLNSFEALLRLAG
ncbi:MAG: flagellar biosynthetic protein FliR [Pyrinomonadaceae bacterium]